MQRVKHKRLQCYSIDMLNNSVLRYKSDMHSEVLDEDIVDLFARNFVIPTEFSYQIVEVTESMVARPDLLSYSLYSDDGYGDLICKLNGIQNPFELNKGQLLVCPAPADLWLFYTDDPYTEKSETRTPKPKKKKEKRRPMDATVDDTRYTIDSGRNIVIY